jgi:peptidyl-tRNA hydrolase, PTH2 family
MVDNDNKQIIMYILVNKDLKMGAGKTAAQVGHVVGVIVEEIIKNAYDTPTPESLEDYGYYEKWTKNKMYKKVTLKATEEELWNFIKTEKKCRYIIDAGLTQIAPDSLTVVGFFPRDDLAEKFKHFKLL